jgi:hypothetical protein
MANKNALVGAPFISLLVSLLLAGCGGSNDLSVVSSGPTSSSTTFQGKVVD